jgi:hypothetical protein
VQTLTGLAKPTDVVEFRRPWAYPDRTNDPNPRRGGNRIETPRTVAGPYPLGATPDVLVGADGPASNELRVTYQNAGCPDDTDQYNESFIGHQPLTPGYGDAGGEDAGGTNPLGDPVVFSAYLIGQIANNPRFEASFNLDADRGYGYLCWDWTRESEGTQQHDPRGHPYFPPDVRPEGTADRDDAADPQHWRLDPPTGAGQVPAPDHQPPLELHYPGRDCVEPGPIG